MVYLLVLRAKNSSKNPVKFHKMLTLVSGKREYMAVINLGSINIDHVYQVQNFVQPGETLSSTGYQSTLGGKGANQSIALAKAGAEVRHVGKLHHSDAGYKDLMTDYGVDGQLIELGQEASGHAIIQVAASGENAIVLFGGANLRLTKQDISLALSGARQGDWLLTQNETSCVSEALQAAKDKGLRVAFNPAPMTDAVKTMPAECVDLLIVNEVEAQELTGCDELESMIEYFRTHWSHAEVLITLGKAGVVMLKHNESIRVDAFVVDAVDTTAAGDTFIGYFLAAYCEGEKPELALKQACAASALAVTKHGAAQSIPFIKDVQAFLKAQN